MAEIIKIDGTRLEVQPLNGNDFSLKEMQNAVGGLIEIIELDDSKSLVLNEEGKILGLPYNRQADKLFHQYFPNTFDFIVGDVLVCSNAQIK